MVRNELTFIGQIILCGTRRQRVVELAHEGHQGIVKMKERLIVWFPWYTCRVKEAIHVRLNPNNINRDSGIEIPEAWIPTIKKHNSRSTIKRTYEGTASNSQNNNEDQNAPITANQPATNSDM